MQNIDEKIKMDSYQRKKVSFGMHGVKLSIDTDNAYEIGKGYYAHVFKIPDTNSCVKVLNDEVENSGLVYVDRKRIKKTLLTIKNLDLKSFYKILDITFIHKFKFAKMQGYVMQCYQDNEWKMIYYDYDWYLRQYNQMLKDYTILGEHRIRIDDLHHQNYRVDEDIIRIDCDNFTITSKKEAINANRIEAFGVILRLLSYSIIDYNLSNGTYYSSEIFSFCRGNPELFFEVLKEYGTPMNYIQNCIENKHNK